MKILRWAILLLATSPSILVAGEWALDFDGLNDWVEIESSPLASGEVNLGFTAEGWTLARTARTAGDKIFYNGPYIQFSISVTFLEEFKFAIKFQNVGWQTMYVPIVFNEVFHFACVYDRDNLRMVVFINGEEVGVLEVPDEIPTSWSTVGMGAYAPNPGQNDEWYDGLIDNIRISEGVRYTESFAPMKILEVDTQTLALWNLEESSGDIVFDSSGNGHDGVIQGASWFNYRNLVHADGSGTYSSIQAAIDNFPHCFGDTIYLANGLFWGPGNRDLDFQGDSIVLASQSGNPDSCIIDCQGTESEPHRGFLFHSGETSEAVIDGITIMGGYAEEGGAIKCENGSSPTIRNCVLRDNYATSGGALHCSESSEPLVEFTLAYSNDASTGGAVFSDNSSPTFENCTISYNSSPIAGAAFLLYSTPSFENCILSHSIDGAAIYCVDSSPVLSCTDVVWNEGGDWVGCIADQQNQNGNFSNTPAFCNPESGDYRLQPGSPCLPEHNGCGVLVGALGEGDCSPTEAEENPTSARVSLAAFPNPFNPHLTITFTLPAEVQGSLVVHDVSGRQVRILKEGSFNQGANEIVWNGQNDHGQDVASGVYFVRLVTEEHRESKKVVLLR
jgi:hypothetical protein